MDIKHAYEVARSQIEHETELLNHRLTWLLILQGFLFAALATGAGVFEKASSRAIQFLIWMGLLTLILVGISTALIARKTIVPAIKQLLYVADWWKKQPNSSEYPDIIWRDATLDTGWFQTEHLPNWLVFAWAVIGGLLVAAALVTVL